MRVSSQFPVLFITGPRQAGKTTNIRALFPDLPYVNLERPDVLAQALDDPRGFLDRFGKSPVIFDEAQRWPQLPSWLQGNVDDDPRPGRFFLTGSNQPLLKNNVVQSLAGRAAYLFQAPFHTGELLGQIKEMSVDEWLFKGFYPPLYDRPFEPLEWFAQYVSTYIERDLSQMIQLKNFRLFHRFLQLLAGRTGQILNMSDLARDADVSHTTARQWLSLLEASYLIFFLQPWHENFQKRLVKSPKVYFWDVGLAGYLAGITQADQWASHPLRGAFFETLVVADLVKKGLSDPIPPEWFFWSSPQGIEIDLLCRRGNKLTALEIKSSQTFRPEHLKNLMKWGALSGLGVSDMRLLYAGKEAFVHQGIQILPWEQNWQ